MLGLYAELGKRRSASGFLLYLEGGSANEMMRYRHI